MADGIEELHHRLVSNDDDLAAFQRDPEPLLNEHGVQATPEQVSNLKQRMAGKDHGQLRHTLQNEGLHAMF